MNSEPESGPVIYVRPNGTLRVNGGVPLSEQWIVTNEQGESIGYREGKRFLTPPSYALCRCGQSRDKPFCDHTHEEIPFDGTETASREPYLDQAETFEGPTMLLTDAESLCALARFCDPGGGIWDLVEQTDDPEARRLVEHEAGHCPAGRLVAWDRETRVPVEPTFEPSIGLIEDTARGVSGPVWVRGGIPIFAADGHPYEVRNQVALCRCGLSRNKPFCDGSHLP